MDSIEESRVALCRFAFILHQIYNTETTEQADNQPENEQESQPDRLQDKRSKFTSFDEGPLLLKRRNDNDDGARGDEEQEQSAFKRYFSQFEHGPLQLNSKRSSLEELAKRLKQMK